MLCVCSLLWISENYFKYFLELRWQAETNVPPDNGDSPGFLVVLVLRWFPIGQDFASPSEKKSIDYEAMWLSLQASSELFVPPPRHTHTEDTTDL